KSISKRHVRRDWLIVPDAIAFFIYENVNNVSPSTGKALMDIFENVAYRNFTCRCWILQLWINDVHHSYNNSDFYRCLQRRRTPVG
uniref:Apovitellenin-1 n=1 Tax=Leptobrachium leishanense TaxID=445787 RepID=A0A8C5LND4_9ANUR